MTIKIQSLFGEKELEILFLDVFLAVGLKRDVRTFIGKTVEFSTVYPVLRELREWMSAAKWYTIMHYNEPEKKWPSIIRVATEATNIHPEMWTAQLSPLWRYLRELSIKDGWDPNKEGARPVMKIVEKCTCTLLGEVSNFTIKYLSEIEMLDPVILEA